MPFGRGGKHGAKNCFSFKLSGTGRRGTGGVQSVQPFCAKRLRGVSGHGMAGWGWILDRREGAAHPCRTAGGRREKAPLYAVSFAYPISETVFETGKAGYSHSLCQKGVVPGIDCGLFYEDSRADFHSHRSRGTLWQAFWQGADSFSVSPRGRLCLSDGGSQRVFCTPPAEKFPHYLKPAESEIYRCAGACAENENRGAVGKTGGF